VVLFTRLQALEYAEAPFTISNGIPTFYLATKFHGSVFHEERYEERYSVTLFVRILKGSKNHSTPTDSFGFEAAL
jgi:hypothetical protein